jgi:alpha-ketoglutarate-dependent 2,4-dichlorophenoxyacetate dioxygenase
MGVCLFPMTPGFAAEVGDVDLRCPLSAEDMAAIRGALATYAVLIFPAQVITTEEHLNFAANFGPLEPSLDVAMKREKLRVRPEVADVANLDAEGNIWKPDDRRRAFQMMGNRLWHTDSSFKTPSAYVSLLYARSVPPVGGNTEYADLRAAYDALRGAMKLKLRPLIGEHSILTSRAKLGMTNFSDAEREAFPPVLRPLVRTIPESGRDSLYLASHVGRIMGLPDDRAVELVDQLTAHAVQRQFVYAHRWRTGDLVMWDNRCTMHRGREFDDMRWPRDMQRATTSDRAEAFGVVQNPCGSRALDDQSATKGPTL